VQQPVTPAGRAAMVMKDGDDFAGIIGHDHHQRFHPIGRASKRYAQISVHQPLSRAPKSRAAPSDAHLPVGKGKKGIENSVSDAALICAEGGVTSERWHRLSPLLLPIH
jgi:hypothetical protein